MASSENSSSESSTEEKQKHQQQPQSVRYRKRAGSKRADGGNISGTTGQTPDNNMIANKENIELRRKRAGSKNIHRLSITIVPENNIDNNNNENASEQEESVFPLIAKTTPSTATLQMNGKDIYSGTWNPKERAVLDQVLNNIGGDGENNKSDQKKSFIRMFKRSGSNKLPSSAPPSPLPASPAPQIHCHHKSIKEQQIDKILEDLEEELGAAASILDDDNIFTHHKEETKYPLSQYYNRDAEQKKLRKKQNNNSNNKFGIFRRIKESVKQRHEEAVLDRQLQHYLPSPNIKKKGIFGRFHSKNKTKNENGVAAQGRSRAHSSNDYARSVGVYVPPESAEHSSEHKKAPTKQENSSSKNSNLSKSKSGSFRNIFSSSNRAKSMDNLNGAFEYYANQKQVFQRTPSMSKLNSRAVSMEKLDHHQKHHQMKRSTSERSLGDHHNNNNKRDLHAFEPVQLTAKELCYEENPMSYAQARFVQQQQQQSTPSSYHHDITNITNHGVLHQKIYSSTPASPHLQRHQHQQQRQHPQSDGYCSAYENDYRGYQSDVIPAMYHRQRHHAQLQHSHFHQQNQQPHRFTFDQQQPQSQLQPPYHQQQHQQQQQQQQQQQRGYSSSDVECNFGSATGSLSYQQVHHQHQHARYHTPQPQLPQQHPYAGTGGNSFQDTTPPPMSPYFLPTQHAPPLPGYYTPGYATPGAVFPRSGYETPNGYTSENDYGYYAHVQYSPHFQRPQPQQQQSGYVAHQSRQAVQRSLSKNSSNSNYSGNFGYASESSFCDDEVYSMVQPPPQGFSPRQLSSSASAEHFNGSSPGIKKPVTNHYQLTTEV